MVSEARFSLVHSLLKREARGGEEKEVGGIYFYLVHIGTFSLDNGTEELVHDEFEFAADFFWMEKEIWEKSFFTCE